MQRIPGWFSLSDQKVFEHFLSSQVLGNLLEVGVYMGKSAIFMENYRKPGEELHVCDVFDGIQQEGENRREIDRSYENLSFSNFQKNFLAFFGKMPEVHICDSRTLLHRLQDKRFRFIHIDGSHLYEFVNSDLSLAIKILQAGDGIIALDDFRAAHTPGVAAAMWEKVVGLELKPVLITNFKAYLSSPKNEFQLSKIQVELMSIGLKTEIVNAMGFEFIRVLSDEKDFGSTRFQIIRRVSPPFVIDLLSYLRWKIRGNS